MKIGSCYICQENKLVQEHHIIPRASGGEAGPVVNLCASCHSATHAQALNLESKGQKHDLFSEREWPRAKNIVEYIRLAIRKNREEPDLNDPAQLFLKMTKGELKLLHMAKTDAGFKNLNKFAVEIIRTYLRNKFPVANLHRPTQDD